MIAGQLGGGNVYKPACLTWRLGDAAETMPAKIASSSLSEVKCGGVVRAGTSAAIIQILFAPPTSAAMSKRAGKYKTLNADQRRKVLPMCPVPLSPMCRAAHQRPDIVPPQSRVYPTASPPAKSTN